MSDPTEPTDPLGSDPTEAAVRDALGVRAEAVSPTRDDPAWLERSIAASAARTRRNRTILGLAAAAILLVAVGLVVVLDGGDEDQVITGSGDSTTTQPVQTTDQVPPTEAPGTTSSTVAPTTSTSSTTAPTTTTTTAPPLPGATTDPKSGPRVGAGVAQLSDLRLGCNPGYDRVVFEFLDGALPEWSVQYVNPPITMDGSGAEVAVAGQAYLQVRMDGAVGHDPETAEPTYTGPHRLSGAGCASVAEVVDTGEFEAIFNWTIGVNATVPFTVSTLTSPSRLVIDIAHP